MSDKLTYKKVSSFGDDRKFFYNFFLQNGYNANASAGIVGNLIQESNLNSAIDKPSGFGSAQWMDTRKTALFDFAKQNGYKPQDRLAQAKFILHELNSTHTTARDILKRARNVDEATEAFSTHYERAGKPMLKNRINYANDVLKSVGGASEQQDLAWKWAKKTNGVNIDSLDKNILAYLNTLEPEYQSMLLATAGSDGSHARSSRHYQKKAVDLRFNANLWDRVAKDPNRIKYGITLLDPNHGTAPHIHFSVGEGSENKKDVWLDPHSESAYEMVSKMKTSDPQQYAYGATEQNNYADKQTLSQAPLDDSYIRKELEELNKRFGKNEEEEMLKAQNLAVRNELLKKQTERDYLVAQTLSAKLPFIEKGY